MEAPAEAAPAALIASSNHKRALETQNGTATPGALIGNALRVASRVRSAYTALRYVANITPNTSPRQISAPP